MQSRPPRQAAQQPMRRRDLQAPRQITPADVARKVAAEMKRERKAKRLRELQAR